MCLNVIKQWTPSVSNNDLRLSFPTFQTTACEWPIYLWLLWYFPSPPFFVFSFTHRSWVICTNYPFPPFTDPRDMSCIANFLPSKMRSVLTLEWEWMRLQWELAVWATLRFPCRQPSRHTRDYGQQNKAAPSMQTIHLIPSISTNPRTVMSYKPVCKFLNVWHLPSLQ